MKSAKSLPVAVENLYTAFSRYPLRKHVEGCPCCVNEADKNRLESKPLRQLTSSDLGRYAFKAMTTWGDKNDFRHFLPRIFELLVSDEGVGWDKEVILGKLALAEWKNWSEEEQAAVRDYLRSGWDLLLLQSQPIVDPDSWLCGTSIAGEDLTPYLDDWTNSRTTNGYDHLMTFVEWHNPAFIKKRSLNNAFWSDSPEGVSQVCKWLTNSSTRQSLESIYFENADADFAPALARAIEHLECFAKM
jgi:hypothetical protein